MWYIDLNNYFILFSPLRLFKIFKGMKLKDININLSQVSLVFYLHIWFSGQVTILEYYADELTVKKVSKVKICK